VPFRGFRPFRRRAVARAAVLAVVAAPGPAWADATPPALVLSHYESDVLHLIDRDGAYSVAVPGSGETLWIFGDSFWNGGYLFGSTAAAGPLTPGYVPTNLTELPTPPTPVPASASARGPERFLPEPTGLYRPDGAACVDSSDTAPATWPTGAAVIPGSYDVLVTLMDVCITLPGTISVERYGVAEYDPVTNTFIGITPVFASALLPFQFTLGSPVFGGDGYLYLFGSVCDDDGNASGVCASGRVITARVPAYPGYWRNPFSYTFWTGSAWSSDASLAASVLPGARPAALVNVGDARPLGKGFVLVEQLDITGGYRIWRSDSLTGGWTPLTSGFAPCGHSVISFDVCRTYAVHPDISTAGQLFMSYFDPAEYHTGVLAVPW
jgi:hypothetical protein